MSPGHRLPRRLPHLGADRFQFRQEQFGGEHEHAAVPEIIAAFEESLRRFAIGFFDEAFNRRRRLPVRGSFNITIAGGRPGRAHAEGYQLLTRDPGRLGESLIQRGVGIQFVVGRQYQHQRLRFFGHGR